VSARTYLSIGDVLSLLRQEFPDVTISKIRFLESQGLVNPERTPSGYRKFYDHDVERLRWVLRQQREHFLPLKVIKGRLEQEGDDADLEDAERDRDEVGAERSDADLAGGDVTGRPDANPVHSVPALVGSGAAGSGALGEGDGTERGGERSGPTLPGFETHPSAARGPAPTPRPARSRPAQTAVGAAPAPSAGAQPPAEAVPESETAPGAARSAEAATPAAGAPRPAKGAGRGEGRSSSSRSSTARPDDSGAGAHVVALSGTSMTLEELAAASGSSVEATAELESYRLVQGRVVGGVTYYDEDALTVARLAAGFAEFGVEARHLRLHKHAAEREAGFIEQIVLPLLRQRNPESRQRAQDTTAELGRLGQAMRAVLLRGALRDVLGG